MPWEVLIKAYEGGKVVRKMLAQSKREADRIARGAEINLNTDDYYVDIIPIKGADLLESNRNN